MGIVNTNLKIFRFPEKIDSLPETNPAILPPLHIRIKPTNACNHRCWYCAYHQDDFQLGKDMQMRDSIPRQKILEIVDDIIEMGVKAVTFSGGGEPFLYPYLPETVQRLAHGGVKIASLTNGSRLAGELAELFARLATWVRVSMDGWDAGSYAQYRGVSQDEFARVMNNMAAFKRLPGSCYLGVVLNIGKENALHVYEMVKNLHGIGVNSVKIAPTIISNSGPQNNDYHQPHFESVRAQIQQAIAEFASPQFEIFDSYHKQLTTFMKNYRWCPNLQITPVIAADQNVYTCQDKAYNLDDGLLFSIKEQRFKDGWMAAKTTFFKTDPSLVCNHHCVADGKNRLILEYLDADPQHGNFV